MPFQVANVIPVLCCGAWAMWLHHDESFSLSSARPLGQIGASLAVFMAVGLTWMWIIYPYMFHPLKSVPIATADWRYRLYRWTYAEPNPPQLLAMANATPNKGFIRYTGTWGRERLLITDGDIAKQILSAQAYSAFPQPLLNRQRFERLVGRGLIWAEGETHKVQRRKLHHAFNHGVITDLYPHFWEKACQMVTLIEKQYTKPSSTTKLDLPKTSLRNVNLTDWTTRAALDLIGFAAWGTDFNTLSDPESTFNTVFERQFVPYAEKMPFLDLGLLFPPWLTKLVFRNQYNIVRDSSILTTKASIAAVKTERRAIEEKDTTRHNILNVAIKSGAFTDQDLIGQMQNILVAGHETTASTMFFLLYILSQHPEKQERLRKEIRSNIPTLSTDEPPDPATLQHLPYLQACINETLRLWPVLSIISREATKDTVVNGLMIPKDTYCAIPPFVLHHSKEVWGSDADNFNPDRWLESADDVGGHKSVFVSKLMTFSVGPKQCIGQDFARGELLALTSAIVGRFHVELEEPEKELKLFWGIIMKPLSEFGFKLERVDEW